MEHVPEQTPAPEQEPQKQSEENRVVPSVTERPRLFDQVGVAVGSLLGTPVAGGILLAVNGLKVGKVGGALVGLVMGLILTYSLLGLLPMAARYAHPLVLLPVGAGIMWWVAGVLQGEWLAAHRKTGGRVMAVPAAVGVGVVTAAALFFVLKPMVTVRPVAQEAGKQQQQPTTQVIRPTELSMGEKQAVKYFPPVTEEEAKRIGQALMAVGYFDKTGVQARDVVVARDRGEPPALGPLFVMFPMIAGRENDPEVLKGYARVVETFVRSGIRPPFVIRMIGADGKVLKDIKAEITARPVPGQTGGAGMLPPTTKPGVGFGVQ